MRPSQKSNRNRGKSNRGKSLGNVVNRVFESAGPEGKVRGTPQQIIDKYEQLARDAQTAGDRVVAENFLQHAEHYARMLSAAQAEQQSQQSQPSKRDGGDGAAQQGGGGKRGDQNRSEDDQDDQQPQPSQNGGGRGEARKGEGDGGLETIETRDESASPLVSTPEQPAEEPQSKPKPARRRRARRSDKGEGGGESGSGEGGGSGESGGEAAEAGGGETVSG